VPPPPKDVLLVGPPTKGGGFAVLRERQPAPVAAEAPQAPEAGDQGGEPRAPPRQEPRLEVGELRALREGMPISGGGEIVRLRQRPEHGRLFDVEVLADLPPARQTSPGPPKVSSDAYRKGWEQVFGSARGTIPHGDN
jgi:hypothetical protein